MLTVRCVPAEIREAAAILRSARGAFKASDLAKCMPSSHELLVAERNGMPAGAIEYSIDVDRTGLVCPPAAVHGSDTDQIADTLLQAVIRRLDAAGAWIGQCLLRPDEQAAPSLVRNGFHALATILLLSRDLSSLPPSAAVAVGLSRRDVSRHPHAIAEILAATWTDSLDCPALLSSRSPAEVIAAHCLTAGSDQHAWWLYEVAGRPAGLLIIRSECRRRSISEIVYFGVVPGERGRGFGRALVNDALHALARDGQRRVRLAVDSANQPAQRIYSELGFSVDGRLRLFARLNPARRQVAESLQCAPPLHGVNSARKTVAPRVWFSQGGSCRP